MFSLQKKGNLKKKKIVLIYASSYIGIKILHILSVNNEIYYAYKVPHCVLCVSFKCFKQLLAKFYRNTFYIDIG